MGNMGETLLFMNRLRILTASTLGLNTTPGTFFAAGGPSSSFLYDDDDDDELEESDYLYSDLQKPLLE